MAQETQRYYDAIFLEYTLPDMSCIEAAKTVSGMIDKNTIIIMASFFEWNKIKSIIDSFGVDRFISKPLFPSAILDSLNAITGRPSKNIDMESNNTGRNCDFSGVTLLLAEDVEINREILITLLENTKIKIDIAENGLVAVQKIKDDPNKYDVILMDVQMPDMNGYEATRIIRSLDSAKAAGIPIIAMTANAFKEDIEKCSASGMNDHLAKPIDIEVVMEKILFYSQK